MFPPSQEVLLDGTSLGCSFERAGQCLLYSLTELCDRHGVWHTQYKLRKYLLNELTHVHTVMKGDMPFYISKTPFKCHLFLEDCLSSFLFPFPPAQSLYLDDSWVFLGHRPEFAETSTLSWLWDGRRGGSVPGHILIKALLHPFLWMQQCDSIKSTNLGPRQS